MTYLQPSEHFMSRGRVGNARYVAPSKVNEIGTSELLSFCGRVLPSGQTTLFPNDPLVYWAGDLNLLKCPAVAVIGSRDVSADGVARAMRISKLLSNNGVTVVSGLAKGVDTAAHKGTIEAGGRTVGVIGTPIEKAYPAENSTLQTSIYKDHLLVSQFPPGARTFPSDFPKRNRLMAAISDASIIVEASDTSGSLHQAVECTKLGRWLFIMRSVIENPNLTWPQRFLNHPNVAVLTSIDDVLTRVL